MQKDLRSTPLYQQVLSLHHSLRQPGSGQISDATEVHASPDGQHAVFSGTLVDALEGVPPTRICQVNLRSADTRVLTFGPHTDRLPRYSPDGHRVAFLSDRHKPGDFQLYLLNTANGSVRPGSRVDGWVEYLQWSPDGKRILLGVAGYGADIAGRMGAVPSQQSAEAMPSWMPTIETGSEGYRWRQVWVYEVATNRAYKIGPDDSNVWEAVWCGDDALVVVASSGPSEGLWYDARLHWVDLHTGQTKELYRPAQQLGWPVAAPSGKQVAVVEAFCSDRGSVAGDLLLIDTEAGLVRRIETRNVDITSIEWRSDRLLLVAGHRGFEVVVGLCDSDSGVFKEAWCSRDVTTAEYIKVSGVGPGSDCLLVAESSIRAPEIAVIRDGRYEPVRSFAVGAGEEKNLVEAVEPVAWSAPDGLEIQGWLLRPKARGPRPLVMNVHGGPVAHWRPAWLGRRGVSSLMLLSQGCAVFLPNPRGSSGRGQAFARQVLGDMGGADTFDYLSGLDHLVALGVADASRLGVLGVSYGGFMAAWLITQDRRFAAAVSACPVINFVTEHLISNIPHFVKLFLADDYANCGGKYFQRSPVMHARAVSTPTLNICGALDRCTPPEEAIQFYNALRENGVISALVTYPEEGHAVRKFPARIDYETRVVSWLAQYLGLSGTEVGSETAGASHWNMGPPKGR